MSFALERPQEARGRGRWDWSGVWEDQAGAKGKLGERETRPLQKSQTGVPKAGIFCGFVLFGSHSVLVF